MASRATVLGVGPDPLWVSGMKGKDIGVLGPESRLYPHDILVQWYSGLWSAH